MKFKLVEELNEFNIEKICKKVNKKYNCFGGNCGAFALSMCRILAEFGKEPVMCFAIDRDIAFTAADLNNVKLPKKNLTVGELSKAVYLEDLVTTEGKIYHVYFYVDNNFYDGGGKISMSKEYKYMSKFCDEEYGDPQPIICYFDYELKNDNTFRQIIEWNTNLEYDVSSFEYNIRNMILKEIL